MSYVRASIASSIQFKPMQTVLSFNNQIINTNAYMLFIANSNEMGYGMSLTPKASLNDGLLDLVIVSKLNLFDKIILGMRVCKQYQIFALIAMIFAGLTSVVAKVGLKNVASDLDILL